MKRNNINRFQHIQNDYEYYNGLVHGDKSSTRILLVCMMYDDSKII
jgi:hypothetical protein